MKRLLLLLWLVLFCVPGAGHAAVREARLGLQNGTLQIHDLNAVLCGELHLPHCPAGGCVQLDTPAGTEFLAAVNACLWNGCSLTVAGPSSAVVRLEAQSSPGKAEAVRRLCRIYAAERAPHATAMQARHWGLLLPAEKIDSSRPLVVLIHGLDADRSDCQPIGQLLESAGRQVAYFSYPGDQPIADSAALLGRSLAKLCQTDPHVSIDIVAHSMGSLVARQYVEGPDYAGGVDRMILVAPPNHGSKWARLRTILSVEENYHLRRDDPNWHWTWLVTEGMGEAGNDLLPGSEFLDQLNVRPLRAGVRYTIIAGDRSRVNQIEGNTVARLASFIPVRSRHWWGIRSCYNRLQRKATKLYRENSTGDGPVSLASAALPGVSDFVVLPADHVSLYLPVDGAVPAAWPVIRDRIIQRTGR